ncbi:MAG TPA: recombinase family protein [Solirubrobacterales bacterium]
MQQWLGYVRVSRVGDRAETLISPEQQAQRIEGYAESRGLQVRMLEPELDVSGGRIDRPVLSQALQEIERGEAAGLIVAQLDRLSRMTIIEALKTIERIEAAGGKVIAVAENFDVDTDEGRTSRNLFLVMGDMQLNRYKSQFRNAKEQAVLRGIWPMPIVPRGYVKGEDRKLHPGPKAPDPRKAMEMRANDASWAQIADEVGGLGLTGARKMVRNRVYLGEIHYGEWVNLEAHEPIVTRDLFEAAQIYHPPPPRSRRARPALLAGLVYCAGCGYRMSVDSHAGIFKCRPHKAPGKCPSPAIVSKRKLEGAVSGAVRQHMESVGLRYEAVERRDAIAEAERELDDAEAELVAYQTLVKISEVGAEHFAQGMRKRVEAVEAARKKLARARLAAPALPSGSLEDLTEDQWRQGLRGAIGGVWIWKAGRRGGARFRIIAAGFEPATTGALAWSDADLPGEIRPLGS